MGKFITPDGKVKFYKGNGRKSDKNIEDYQDKRQNAYLNKIDQKKELPKETDSISKEEYQRILDMRKNKIEPPKKSKLRGFY